MKLLIDTSILIDNLRGGTVFLDLLDAIEKENALLYLPTVVIFELFSGKSTKQEAIEVRINTLVNIFERIELTDRIAKRAGELYRDINKQLGAPDYIIAATALELHASVVTLNRKHFQHIPQLSLYSL
jgi:predicted nucleic acid-binding protein